MLTRRVAVALLSLLAAGCAAKERIPTYPPMNERSSLAIVQSHQPAELTAEGALTLIDRRGRSIQLDAVLAVRPPDSARVRAWKFGQAVFDLTITADGIWLFASRREGMTGEPPPPLQRSGDAVRSWLTAFSSPLDDVASIERADQKQFLMRRPIDAGGGAALQTIIDRRTLTVRRHTILDATGRERFVMQLDRYADFGGGDGDETIWPTRIETASADGRIIFATRKLYSNVTPAAFVPSPRSEKIR